MFSNIVTLCFYSNILSFGIPANKHLRRSTQRSSDLILIIVFTILSSVFFLGATAAVSADLKWFTQPLDHFVSGGESRNRTFQQRVYVDYVYRDGRRNEDGMPILVYLGGEASMELYVGGGGILTMLASQYRAVMVYIEHRFYGKSVPLGSIEAAMGDPYVRGCLTSRQALADFANVIRRLKSDWSVPHSPVIVFGGSYAGMLAAWFRMKYPQVANGALASSAPVLVSQDLVPENQYCSIVSRDFKNVNGKCYEYISRSWGLIDEVADQSSGLDKLSEIFKTCGPLSSVFELKLYLAQTYNYAAQYNGRFGQIPQLCSIITQATEENILKGIKDALLMFTQSNSCNNISQMVPGLPFSVLDPASQRAWDWQVCNELVPHEGCGNSTMFETSPFSLSQFSQSCYEYYGVYPHPEWISTYYGGQDLKSTLRTSSSNIIFSNGLFDPYSGASILEDISSTIVAITTKEGSHCLDLDGPKNDDPKWLRRQRERELKIISHWIKSEMKSSSSSPSRSLGRSFLLFVVVLFVHFL